MGLSNSAERLGGAMLVLLLGLACLAGGTLPATAQTGSARTGPAQTGPAGAAIGQVVKLQGAASATHGKRTRMLDIGSSVEAGDRLVTGIVSKLEVRFHDGTRLTVGPGTEIALTDYAPEAHKPGILTLLIGIVRTSLAGIWKGSDFEVRTRTAVASARSTEWITEAKHSTPPGSTSATNTTAVLVLSGTVAVAGRQGGRTVDVRPGFGTDVGASGPSTPVRWGQARARDARERTQIP